jgi:ABC-2 type transport system ATP-binding protein
MEIRSDLAGRSSILSAPILTTTNVTKRFGRTAAVDGVTLELRAGESVCVVGPNGAGKTTLLLLLAGITLPSSGHVRVFGLDRWRDNFQIRQRSTFLTTAPLFGAADTPYEFLRFYAQVYGMDKRTFLERLRELAGGLEMLNHLSKPWAFLSSGMVKKAGIIAAFLPDADLRILDEPFAGGIDPFAMEFLFRRIKTCCGMGETIVFSTQVLEQAETISDRILLFERGRIAALGAPEELFALAGVSPDAPRALYQAFMELTRRNAQ